MIALAFPTMRVYNRDQGNNGRRVLPTTAYVHVNYPLGDRGNRHLTVK